MEDILILHVIESTAIWEIGVVVIFKLTLWNACGINKYKEYFEWTDKTDMIATVIINT